MTGEAKMNGSISSKNDASHSNCCSYMLMKLSNKFDGLSQMVQLIILTSGVFVFFGANNVLQEAIMNIPGFRYGMMLGYLEVLGVTVCSFLERTLIAHESGRIAPISAYPMLTMCLLSSSSLGTLALNYINFPTKVVFRSCKLLPTMMIASILNRKKKFSLVEYLCALGISIGLIFFAAADWSTAGPKFNSLGITFVSLSIIADALLPNAQERLFTKYGASRLEVTFYTNVFTLMAMTVTTYFSGDLYGLFYEIQNSKEKDSSSSSSSFSLLSILIIYTFVFYLAISFHMNIVKRFGGVTAVLVATARKGLSLILSFVLFPKVFSWFYVAGAILVLGGLLISSLTKIKNKKETDAGKLKRLHSKEEYLRLMRASLQNNDNNNTMNDTNRSPSMDHLDMLEKALEQEEKEEQEAQKQQQQQQQQFQHTMNGGGGKSGLDHNSSNHDDGGTTSTAEDEVVVEHFMSSPRHRRAYHMSSS